MDTNPGEATNSAEDSVQKYLTPLKRSFTNI